MPWIPTPNPRRTALPSPSLLQEPPSLCLTGAQDSPTSSLLPFTSDSPSDLGGLVPAGEVKKGRLALWVTPLDRCLETAWLGELQDVDGGALGWGRSWRMKRWEVRTPGMAQELRPKSCACPYAPSQSLTSPPVSWELPQKCHSFIHSFIQQIVGADSTRCWGHRAVSAPPWTPLG